MAKYIVGRTFKCVVSTLLYTHNNVRVSNQSFADSYSDFSVKLVQLQADVDGRGRQVSDRAIAKLAHMDV